MVLWVSIAIVTLLTTALVVWPLVSKRPASAADARDDEQRRLAVFRDRKREIERERQAGRLSDEEAAQAQNDLLQQLAVDLPEAAATNPAPAHPSRSGIGVALTAIAVAVLVPLIAVGVYRQVGAPQWASVDPSSAETAPDARQIEALIAQIEQRTRENPDDGEAWAMLAEARKMQGRHAEAVPAFEKALERLPEDARLLTDFAESAALLAGGDFSGRPLELLERALKADATEPKAIALMGAAQYRLGNLERARGYLRQLSGFLTPGTEEAGQIAAILERIDAELGQRASAPTQPAGGGTVAGTVTVDPSLAAQAAAGGTLFVIARESGGPPVPVAVLRVPQAAFPASFELDESNTMDPARRLSGAKPLEIEARLSRSGETKRQPGDLYGRVADVRIGQHDLTIVLDRVVTP